MTTTTVTPLPALPGSEPQTTRLSSLDFVLHLFLLVWCVSPPLAYSLLCRIGSVAVVLLLTAKVMFKSLTSVGNRYFIILYPLLIVLVVGLSLLLDCLIYEIQTLIFICISICAWNTMLSPPSRFQRNLFLFITFVLCSFWIYITYSILSINPHVMRLLVKNSERSQEFAMLGIGGYGFIYALVLMFPFGIGTATERNAPFLLRAAALWFCISLIMLTLKSKFFMALLLMIGNGMFYIAFRFTKQRMTAVTIMLIFATIGLFFAEEILTLLIEMIDIPAIQHKLADTLAMLNNDMDVEDSEFATRSARYLKDLRVIITSPIWGSLDLNATGNHSHILDFAALFGLPLAVTFLHYCWNSVKLFTREHTPAVPTCIIIAVLLLTLNKLAYSFASALFILLPIFASKESDRQEEKCN